jgi:hypothetical protein
MLGMTGTVMAPLFSVLPEQSEQSQQREQREQSEQSQQREQSEQSEQSEQREQCEQSEQFQQPSLPRSCPQFALASACSGDTPLTLLSSRAQNAA